MINVRLWWSYGDRAGISLWSCWDRTRIVLRSYCDRIMIITLWSAQIPHTTITFQVFAISFANSRDSLSVALLSRTPNDMMPFLVFLLIKTLKISLAGSATLAGLCGFEFCEQAGSFRAILRSASMRVSCHTALHGYNFERCLNRKMFKVMFKRCS